MEGTRARQIAVRIIFDKYVHEGYGAQRIATYSNKLDCRAWSGKMWHHATIRGIICNLTYTGVLRSGENGIIDKLVRQIFERINPFPKRKLSMPVTVKRWRSGKVCSVPSRPSMPKLPPSSIC